MKKLVFILSFFLVSSISFSQDKIRNEWDCKNIEYYVKLGQEKIIPLPIENKADKNKIYQIALGNLIKYCSYSKDTLQTPYFINHLIDTYFRYLDWIKTENYYGPLYPPGVQRRKFLNQVAQNNFTNTNPEEIKQLYKTEFIEKIEPLYFKICVNLPHIKKWLSYKDSKDTNKINPTNIDQDTCNKLATNRIKQETLLIRWIIFKTMYNTYQKNLFNWFKKFASKWDKLYNLFIVWLGDFEYLVTKFIKVTDANTK